MKFTEMRPEWFYSYVTIANLESIQQEMRVINSKKNPTNFNTYNPYYTNIFKHEIDEKDYPHTKSWLLSVGLYHKFYRILLTQASVTAPAVHVDTYDPMHCNCSLNIPLDYCDNTYTAFYKTDKPELVQPCFPDPGEKQARNFAWLNAEHAVEVAKVETIRPILVNTSVLHRALSDEPRRSICSFRFFPELNLENVKRLGIEKPFEQVD